ncbi:MAG: VWA domain-containing protein, partial [bacterium]|nr:VWA domain-containing protein [bacterium]
MLNKIFAASVLALLCALAAYAQTGSQLTGVVTDPEGAVIPDATVTIKNLHTGATVVVQTNRSGRYVALLASGTFEVTITSPGFNILKFRVRIPRGRTVRRDVALSLGSVMETIEVTEGPPSLHTSASMAVVVQRGLVGDPNTEEYGLIQESGFRSVENNPLSTFSIDVDTASYSNMRRFLRERRLPPVDAVRIEELINYFRYDYPEPEGEEPFSITTEIAGCPWKAEHQLLHVGLKARSVPMENLPANNLVLLLDVSGSMQPANKLPLLRRAFSLLTNQLRPQDRVAIVVYSGAAGLVLPSTPGSEKERVLAAISRLHAGGSTAGGAG